MAIEFAILGTYLTLSDINLEGLEETQNIIKQKTGRTDNLLLIKLDVSNREEVTMSTTKAMQHFGPVDILINNAGVV